MQSWSYCGGAEDDVHVVSVIRHHVLHQAGHGGHDRWGCYQSSLLGLEEEPVEDRGS